MHFLSSSFLDANLPFLALLLGVSACLMLYLGLGYQVQTLRRALLRQKRRVERLEQQLAAPAGSTADSTADGGERENASGDPAPATARQKVLQLHGLGRSSEEIARQAGMREAEVDFVLRVQQHLETPGRALALRKIS
jgi:DNA-binding NarL/FixJ family response regulator